MHEDHGKYDHHDIYNGDHGENVTTNYHIATSPAMSSILIIINIMMNMVIVRVKM